MLSAGFPFALFGKLECNVDNAGRGDLSCTLALLGGALSGIDCDLDFTAPKLPELEGSASDGSSCTL